jgi:hypothetical protein
LSILLTRKFVCLLCGDFVERFAIQEHLWHAGRAGPKDNAGLAKDLAAAQAAVVK